MTQQPSREIFIEAMKERVTNRPFVRISAYKVRESRGNIENELRVVHSIAHFVSTPPRSRNRYALVSCTPEDKAQRFKDIPRIIAQEFGQNLIPAIEALHVEGVPRADIKAFVATLKPLVNKLLKDCDAVRAVNNLSVRPEYGALKNGTSLSQPLCQDALRIADAAVDFAKKHGVLR